jgi:GFO/IDH/MocA oxidoreductase family protein
MERNGPSAGAVGPMKRLPPHAIGFALLGAGAGAAAHAEALSTLSGARLVVVADPDLERARVLAGRHGVGAFDDPGAALARDDVQAARIVVPNHGHAPLARASSRSRSAAMPSKPRRSWTPARPTESPWGWSSRIGSRPMP